eukprot:10095293-Alexandrium_andersonii.AAC.1
MGFVDQLDLVQAVATEYACRELLKVEMAAQRNPKVPDWEGLSLIAGTRPNEGGGAAARRFTLKQARQFREEQDAASKQKAKGPKGGAKG